MTGRGRNGPFWPSWASTRRCRGLWSNPGDNHVAIVRYTGAIRRDLTLDPDDPRFQGFAVGYGRSAEAAEENATTVNARFATHYDASGYEVLVAESWAVGAGTVAAVRAPGAAPAVAGGVEVSRVSSPVDPARATGGQTNPDRAPPVDAAEMCAGRGVSSACWMELSNQPGCHLWHPRHWEAGRTGTWNGQCSGGYAQGPGTVEWRNSEGETHTGEGSYVDGKPHGRWTHRYPSGTVEEGPFVDGEEHGDWLLYTESGSILSAPYAHAKRHGDWIIWAPDGRVFLLQFVDGEQHGMSVACEFGETANLSWVRVYENGGRVEGHYNYDDIEDPQLARTAAATCARLLAMERPSPRRDP